MKLPDFLEFKPFNDIRREMGAHELGEFSLNLNWEEISLEEVAILEKEGIDVDVSDLKFLNDGTIAYKNRRVLLYIRDWKIHGNYSSLPKFHISHCSTLEDMIRQGRFKRYVVSTRTDGIFNFNLIQSNENQVYNREEKLDVCKNCLKYLNYNDYSSDRYKAFETFDLNEFFARFACSPIKTTPLETDKTAPLSVYPDDWNARSIAFKNAANWICHRCKKDFSGGKSKFLHSHHKDGNTFDNRPSNIEVLCIFCHSKEPYHGQLRGHAHYKEYIKSLI
jgi:hypothetical protein